VSYHHIDQFRNTRLSNYLCVIRPWSFDLTELLNLMSTIYYFDGHRGEQNVQNISYDLQYL
jgi:hypothetical protein